MVDVGDFLVEFGVDAEELDTDFTGLMVLRPQCKGSVEICHSTTSNGVRTETFGKMGDSGHPEKVMQDYVCRD